MILAFKPRNLNVQFQFSDLKKILSNLIRERYIQSLIAICEIYQFHLHFSVFSFHPSLTGDLSLVRYVWGVFRVLLGRTFVSGLGTKTLKTLKT